VSLRFRWLGVAGVELCAGDQVLTIDPFFTRPTLLQMLHPIQSDPTLVFENAPSCNVVLVTHAHYDHLLDIPLVLHKTGAVAYGSTNTCQLLRRLGVPEAQLKITQAGDQLSLGAFRVEVIEGQHSPIPLGKLFNGSLSSNLHPPLHVWDYRMDTCLGYAITAMGRKLLICAAEPRSADILFCVAQEPKNYYLKLFPGVAPQVFIPIHWDNFTRPLSQSLRRFTRPGRLALWQLTDLCKQVLPHTKVIIPEIFTEYSL